jgi:hypothetical protein
MTSEHISEYASENEASSALLQRFQTKISLLRVQVDAQMNESIRRRMLNVVMISDTST